MRRTTHRVVPEWIYFTEEAVLFHCFDNARSTSKISEAEDHGERNFGSQIDLQLYDDWNRQDGEQEVRDTVY